MEFSGCFFVLMEWVDYLITLPMDCPWSQMALCKWQSTPTEEVTRLCPSFSLPQCCNLIIYQSASWPMRRSEEQFCPFSPVQLCIIVKYHLVSGLATSNCASQHGETATETQTCNYPTFTKGHIRKDAALTKKTHIFTYTIVYYLNTGGFLVLFWYIALFLNIVFFLLFRPYHFKHHFLFQ